MSLMAKDSGGEKLPPLEQGVHMATCYMVADVGEQYQKTYDKWSQQVVIGWEIIGETVTIDGQEQPRTMHKFYTMSLGAKANLRKDLESWRGKQFTQEELNGFDLRNIIGVGCQLQIIHNTKDNGDVYAKISAIMSLPKGMTIPQPSQRIAFDMDTDMAKLEQMPRIVQKAVAESKQVKGEEAKPFDEPPEESPFGMALPEGEGELPF